MSADSTPLADELVAVSARRERLRGATWTLPSTTRIVTIANQKGGVGKTTTTVNLAAVLAAHGARVLVIDLDPQGNASTALGVPHHERISGSYEVLLGESAISDVVQQSPEASGLWCLPATINLAGAEIELVAQERREFRLKEALTAYLSTEEAQGFHYIFVDTPPSLGILTINAFAAANEVLIPIQCEYYALEGLSQLLDTIERIRAHVNPLLQRKTIALTMYDQRTNLAQQVAQDVQEHFPQEVLATIIPRSVRISEAPSYGQSVITYDPGSPGALSYAEAALEFAGRFGGQHGS
ncbi:ParA family protein [Pontimonas sp.]|jgi:chromosome partitioning protein|uniref:ParA family protein n=1 Tax=Pontimonas sp. TaxID=2304492 RepID=UPI0028702A9D|nr:ParA family protein [Pontimonas sp.]MDR9396785.1 ParA family protein [Pontimonas sp.]MDR9434237.1 ParA family protein [Pontimonas sp.]